jgi:hypothetical protein
LAGLISARIKKIWVDKKNPASPDPAWVIFYLKFASPDLDQNPGSGQAPHQTWPIAGLYAVYWKILQKFCKRLNKLQNFFY